MTNDECLALLDENAHLAAYLDDLRRDARAVVDAAPVSKEALRVALIELRDNLDALDRINKTVGGWGPKPTASVSVNQDSEASDCPGEQPPRAPDVAAPDGKPDQARSTRHSAEPAQPSPPAEARESRGATFMDEKRRIEERLVVTDLCDMHAFHKDLNNGRMGRVLRRAVNFIEGQECFPSYAKTSTGGESHEPVESPAGSPRSDSVRNGRDGLGSGAEGAPVGPQGLETLHHEEARPASTPRFPRPSEPMRCPLHGAPHIPVPLPRWEVGPPDPNGYECGCDYQDPQPIPRANEAKPTCAECGAPDAPYVENRCMLHYGGQTVMLRPDEPRGDALERAFWRFDALHKAHYRDVDSSLPGPLSEREAFKRAASELVRGACTETALPPVICAVITAAERLAEEVWSDNRLDEELEELCRAVQAMRAVETGSTDR